MCIFSLSEHRIERAVFRAHILHGCHRDNQRDLRQETCDAERQKSRHQLAEKAETVCAQLNSFHVAEIPDRQECRQNLTDDRCHSSAHHAPPKTENENWVKDDIGDCANNRGDHRKARTAIRTDDRIDRLSEHIKRNAKRDPEKVFLCISEGSVIDPPAKQCQDRVHENQVNRGEHNTADDAEQHRIANAFVRVFFPVRAKAKADKSTAAIADHDGHGKRQHGQRENNRIGSVAVGAQIVCIGDKDLIHDIIQRSDQQRNHTRDCIPAHQPADFLCFQKGIESLFHCASSCQNEKRVDEETGFTPPRPHAFIPI